MKKVIQDISNAVRNGRDYKLNLTDNIKLWFGAAPELFKYDILELRKDVTHVLIIETEDECYSIDEMCYGSRSAIEKQIRMAKKHLRERGLL